jgi:hypothetical protein
MLGQVVRMSKLAGCARSLKRMNRYNSADDEASAADW